MKSGLLLANALASTALIKTCRHFTACLSSQPNADILNLNMLANLQNNKATASFSMMVATPAVAVAVAAAVK